MNVFLLSFLYSLIRLRCSRCSRCLIKTEIALSNFLLSHVHLTILCDRESCTSIIEGLLSSEAFFPTGSSSSLLCNIVPVFSTVRFPISPCIVKISSSIFCIIGGSITFRHLGGFDINRSLSMSILSFTEPGVRESFKGNGKNFNTQTLMGL